MLVGMCRKQHWIMCGCQGYWVMDLELHMEWWRIISSGLFQECKFKLIIIQSGNNSASLSSSSSSSKSLQYAYDQIYSTKNMSVIICHVLSVSYKNGMLNAVFGQGWSDGDRHMGWSIREKWDEERLAAKKQSHWACICQGHQVKPQVLFIVDI